MKTFLLVGAASLSFSLVSTAAVAAGTAPPQPQPPAVSDFSAGFGATIFSSRAAFDAAAGATVSDDFEVATPTSGGIGDVGYETGKFTDANGTLISLATLPVPTIVNGVPKYLGVVNLNVLDYSFLNGAGTIGAKFGSDVLTTNYEKIVFTFDHAVTSFGIDFGSQAQFLLPKADRFAFSVDGFGSQTANSQANGLTFFGFTSTTAFTSVTVDTTTNTLRYFDNLAISAPAAAGDVPEPATWGLMLAGFGLVGGAMRRRAKVAVRFA